ncbi:TetR/AcrR family transcriptional regulator [Cellulomonas denverensis]|uniref:TetR/AcrR family transcriptional regulator n=1 Tax=Cellulomonas denverensis TaxID=264297 RepID=A0A7X6QYM4_9CELL|nr:TetR/AcrR family transcriptional regulator [Cellulomonas denverensis]NKY22297.1 TetR/AcrR family transcriptional regulator [Cellulomonas denverensis]GIG25874.1 hypothetical protein Cde04nite_21180 [Cellulomonas denverensis]
MERPEGVRARARRELVQRITDTARRQLAEVGAAGLSVRAVTRELGMAPSAVYRYFPSRDALLTTLIVEAFQGVADAALGAERAVARDDLAGRWTAVYRAVRDWGLARPHEYALIYGSPVPGYVAPEETAEPAARVPLLLAGIACEAWVASMGAGERQEVPVGRGAGGSGLDAGGSGADGSTVDRPGARGSMAGVPGASASTPGGPGQREAAAAQVDDARRAELAAAFAAESAQHTTGGLADDARRLTDFLRVARPDLTLDGIPAEVALAVVDGWAELVGCVSFELFGHYRRVIDARSEHLDAVARRTGERAGVRFARS